MSDLSRRKFLGRASLGAAAAGIAAASGGVPALFAAQPSVLRAGPDSGPSQDLVAMGEDVIAHVQSDSTGAVTILVGNREIVVQDRAMVGRILASARQAARGA